MRNRLITASTCSRRTAAALGAAALGLTFIAGCADKETPSGSSSSPLVKLTKSSPGASEPGPPEPEPSESQSSQSSEPGPPEPEPTEPTPPDASPNDSTEQRARAAQIAAQQLPGFNEDWRWDGRQSMPRPSTDEPGLCLRSSLTMIGAVTEHRSDFTSSLSRQARSTQLTAVFPDEQTAIHASTVLLTWNAKCADHGVTDLELRRVRVGQAEPVDTSASDATSWLSTYGPVRGDPEATWFVAEGFVRDTDTLTYLVFRNAGMDYNYDVGQTPLERGLRVAAERLIKSR
ncbi:MAG: hypothetical protein ACR2GB_09160 [Nocardioidaceae bacterium]